MEIESDFRNLDIANEEQKEQISKVGGLNIGSSQRAELVLIILGEKPATDIAVYKWNDKPECVEKVLKECGLEVVKKSETEKFTSFSVSKNMEVAQKLKMLDPSRDHEEYGKLMGFPESAVEAFVNNDKLDRKKYPDMNGVVFNMSLSNNNWESEIEKLKYWSALLKKYSPDLYKSLAGEE